MSRYHNLSYCKTSTYMDFISSLMPRYFQLTNVLASHFQVMRQNYQVLRHILEMTVMHQMSSIQF